MVSLAITLWAGPVRAQIADDKRSVYLEIEGACPDGETVAHELRPMLDRWELSENASLAQEVVRVIDQGSRMEISALDDIRTVSDPTNDCHERARVAAVFIALRLEPAQVPEVEPPPKQSESEGPETDSPPPQEPLEVEISAGGLVERSVDQQMAWTGGALLGFGLSKSGVLGYFSASVTSRSELEAEGVTLRFQRIPLDWGVGYSFSRGSWTLAPVLSVATDYFRVRAHSLEDATTQGRLEVGPRLSFRATRKFGATRLFGAARIAWFPRDYVVDVEPLGAVMRTPRLWFGVSAGLVFDFSKH